MNTYSEYVPSSPHSPPYANDVQDNRRISRTPSPTPSEIQALRQKGFLNWQSILDRKKMFSKKRIMIYIGLTILTTLVILLIIYDNSIIRAIQPYANRIYKLKFGWLIPVAILFVISFPPLAGQEIVAAVCGLVWGAWVGFGIVALGTFLGEVANFLYILLPITSSSFLTASLSAFKYLCTTRGEKIEQSSVIYSALGRVVREGGFKVAVIVRYSVIPSHCVFLPSSHTIFTLMCLVTTALFAVCGMNIFVYMLAALLSLPKQFINVYIGTLLETSASCKILLICTPVTSFLSSASASSSNAVVSDVVGVITVLITIAAMWYVTRAMNRVKPQIVYERRKARQAKLNAANESLYQNGGANTSAVFNASDVTVPLNSFSDTPYQQWDSEGRAIGYAPDPRIYAPQPKKPENPNPFPGDTTPTLGTKPLRQESTDTVAWELQANAAQGQSYRLSAMATEPLRNPYEGQGEMDAEEVGGDLSSSGVGRSFSSGIGGVTAYAPPPGPPPPPLNTAYAFSAPGNSFSGASSPPPPSYATRQ
ncbi:hypothetical protein BDR04DRAFT_284201 [Suillus decipiens]|nr:hypothetical protein BDR04DRAFT_284201 [Suillus decipiens]